MRMLHSDGTKCSIEACQCIALHTVQTVRRCVLKMWPDQTQVISIFSALTWPRPAHLVRNFSWKLKVIYIRLFTGWQESWPQRLRIDSLNRCILPPVLRRWTLSIIQVSLLHVTWDKDRTPMRSYSMSIARLSCAWKHDECQFNWTKWSDVVMLSSNPTAWSEQGVV